MSLHPPAAQWALARRVEALGFESLWTGDHVSFHLPLYESLAWGYLQAKQWNDAEGTLREGLKREPNNGFALALLVEAMAGAGRRATRAARA